ncbi:MAG: T9SS type A sorting domain-containing protein [Ignavibacteria bacterium]
MKKIIFIFLLTLIFTNINYSNDGPEIWTQTLSGTGAIWQRCISISQSNTQVMYAGSNTSGIWKSTNAGVNWSQVNNGLSALNIQCVEVSPSDANYVYAGTGIGGATAGMYVTTDGGANWTFRNAGIVDSAGAQEIIIHPTNPAIALVAVWNASNFTNSINGVYKTTNGGVTWLPSGVGMGTNKNVICLTRNPSNFNTMYCGTSFQVPNPPGTGPTFVYKSYDAGTTWAMFSTGLPTGATELNAVRTLSVSSLDTSVVLAGLFQNTTNGGAFFSTNGGTSWVRRSNGIPNVVGVQIRSILIRPGSATEFFAGLDNATTGGVYRTTDAGVTWTAFNNGVMLNTYVVRALAFRVASNTLYAGVAGTTGMGIYEYSFPPLGISDPSLNGPENYSLSQNYPNPFNPNTQIDFAIPKNSFVQLKVFNSAGQEVKDLVNGNMGRGAYSINFDGTNLSSGVYFYKLITAEFTSVRKMLLIK